MTFISQPQCYGDEWEHFVDDEARARGIPSNDQQALEDLDDELRTKCQDHYEDMIIEAYENEQSYL